MNIESPAWLGNDPQAPFPPVSRALREPDGLLAAGGDLSPARLLDAYAHGIFPWYSEGQPILWWSPDPRMLFRSDGVRLSRDAIRARPIVNGDTVYVEDVKGHVAAYRISGRAGNQG